MQPPGQPADGQRRFIVCGDNPLAYRLIDHLITQYDAGVTAVVTSVRSDWAPKICELPGIDVVEAERIDTAAFTRARLAEADGLALVDQDDAANIDVALLAQEMRPDLRTIVRMGNIALGDRIAELLNNCVVLSAAAIAAPAFVAAALDDATTAPMTVADRMLVATPRDRARPEDVLTGLAVVGGPRDEPVELPADQTRANLVLARTRRRPRKPTQRPRRTALRMLTLAIDSRIRRVLFLLLLLFLLGAAVIALVADKPLIEAAYIALLSELGGGAATSSTSNVEQITIIVLTFVSLAVIPVLTAMVVDAVVRARLRIEAGGLVEPLSDHVVVVGLGGVGSRVVRSLDEAGVAVVAVEREADTRGVKAARDLDVPVIIGDASHGEVLDAASVATARCLVVASTDDVTNLEVALLGRAANPKIRVVLRLFDGDFAARVQRSFNINISRSVSYLAAPAFAAALLGRQVIATIPVGRHVLLVAEVPVGADSALEGATLADLERPGEARAIAVRTGDGKVLWDSPPGRPLGRTDHIVVVATRVGLSTLVGQAMPGQVDDSAPYRLLSRWQTPHERAGAGGPDSSGTSPEGPTGNPPFGPADAGSTRPA